MCERYKTGRFETHSEINGTRSIIERNDSLQTETNLSTRNITKARIRWISTCEYELSYISSSSDTIDEYIKARPLKNVILKSKKNFYIAKSMMEGIDFTLIDTVRIIK